MKRADKEALVEEMHRTFGTTPHFVLAGFRGVKVNQINELRRKVGDAGGHYRVIKNRLAKRAAEGTGAAQLIDRLEGPCALATHPTDPVVLAKVMSDFAKDNPQLEVLAGVIQAAELVDADGVKRLAALPGIDQLKAQLLALIQTPATTLVRLIQTPAGQLARVVDARRESLPDAAEG